MTDVVPGGSYPRFAVSGHVVYAVGNTLRAVGFDPSEVTVIGSPVPVVEDVTMGQTGAAQFGLAQDGSLVYVTGGADAASGARTLVWVDREGREEPLAEGLGYLHPRVSPDGTRVALSMLDGEGGRDIYIYDIDRRTPTRLTFDPADEDYPVWPSRGEFSVHFRSLPGVTRVCGFRVRRTDDGEQRRSPRPTSHRRWRTAAKSAPDVAQTIGEQRRRRRRSCGIARIAYAAPVHRAK